MSAKEFLIELGYDDADDMGAELLEIIAQRNGYPHVAQASIIRCSLCDYGEVKRKHYCKRCGGGAET